MPARQALVCVAVVAGVGLGTVLAESRTSAQRGSLWPEVDPMQGVRWPRLEPTAPPVSPLPRDEPPLVLPPVVEAPPIRRDIPKLTRAAPAQVKPVAPIRRDPGRERTTVTARPRRPGHGPVAVHSLETVPLRADSPVAIPAKHFEAEVPVVAPATRHAKGIQAVIGDPTRFKQALVALAADESAELSFQSDRIVLRVSSAKAKPLRAAVQALILRFLSEQGENIQIHVEIE